MPPKKEEWEVRKEKTAATDTSTKPSTPPNGKKQTRLNSFEALADIRLEETAAGHVETTSPTEGSKEKKTRKTQRERFEEYKSRLQEKGIVINDENGLWEKFRSIRGRLDYGQIGEFVTFPERKPRGNAKTATVLSAETTKETVRLGMTAARKPEMTKRQAQ